MENETIFADGLMFTRKHENAPEFVLGGLSIKVDEFVRFLEKHKKADGWVNLDMLRPKDKDKKPYFKLNTWKPEQDTATPPEDDMPIPF